MRNVCMPTTIRRQPAAPTSSLRRGFCSSPAAAVPRPLVYETHSFHDPPGTNPPNRAAAKTNIHNTVLTGKHMVCWLRGTNRSTVVYVWEDKIRRRRCICSGFFIHFRLPGSVASGSFAYLRTYTLPGSLSFSRGVVSSR